MTLPFPTHGSNHVYVFEDADSNHKDQFARVNVNTHQCEVLPDVPNIHMRYTSSFIQQNKLWKLGGTLGRLYCFDITTTTWRETEHIVGQSLLVADLKTRDRIWIIGVSDVKSYSISTNLITTHWTGSIWEIPCNQAIAFIPTNSQGAICCVATKSSSKVFDIET